MASINGDIMHIAASSCPPQSPSSFLPSCLTKPLRQYFLNKPSFTAFPSVALCISKQTQVWVTQIHFLCLGRWFSLGEVNMSFKPLQKPPFRQCPAFSKINIKTSLTPDGPRNGTVSKHNSPARHLIHYISASLSFRRAALSYCPTRFPLFAINCLKQLWQLRKRVILIFLVHITWP